MNRLFLAGGAGMRGGRGGRGLLMLLALAFVTMACQRCGPTPVLPQVTLPDVRGLGAFTAGYPGQVLWAVSLAPNPGAAPRPYALASGQDTLAAIDLASGDEQSITLSPSCLGTPALTTDASGQPWLACDTASGLAVARVALASPLAMQPLVPPAPLATNDQGVDVAWAPDGQHLAVLQGTDLALYATAPPYATASLTAHLSLARFVGQCDTTRQVCALADLAWSPDDAWLAFIQNAAGSVSLFGANPLFALHLDALPPTILAPHAQPITLTVPPSAITLVDTTGQITPPVWLPGTAALTYISQDGRRIVEHALPGGVPTTLLDQHVVALGTLAWAPDASYLVFSAVGQATGTPIPELTPTSANLPAAVRFTNQPLAAGQSAQAQFPLGICASALPDLYVYTPPAG